jgi:hypothetical protein
MRLHEQLGGDEPDQEVENMLANWRRVIEEGAVELTHRFSCRIGAAPCGTDNCWPKVRADGADYGLTCPDCDRVTSDGEYCGECISERAEYYIPDEGGSK